jgi:hypothetical protein
MIPCQSVLQKLQFTPAKARKSSSYLKIRCKPVWLARRYGFGHELLRVNKVFAEKGFFLKFGRRSNRQFPIFIACGARSGRAQCTSFTQVSIRIAKVMAF